MPEQKPWSKGAENPPCANCHHQHERSKVEKGVVLYSACKLVILERREHSNPREHSNSNTNLVKCHCTARS